MYLYSEETRHEARYEAKDEARYEANDNRAIGMRLGMKYEQSLI